MRCGRARLGRRREWAWRYVLPRFGFVGCKTAFSGAGRLEVEILPQPGQAAFATEAGLLVAAERRTRIELIERVAPDNARGQALRGIERELPARGPDARAQAVRQIVGAFDRLVGRAKGHDR